MNSEHPFDKEFCSNLEYRLSASFKYSEDSRLKYFWCDGVDHEPYPIEQLGIRTITQTKKIVTRAWIGKDGQDIYEITIHFNESALVNYANGALLVNNLPKEEDTDWWNIDIEKRTIEVYLK